MRYQSLFELELSHSYYQQQRCPDLAIAPTPACQRALQGCRLTLKSRPNGLAVFVSVGEGDRPLVPLEASSTLTFFLKLKNPNFIGATELDPGYRPGSSVYFFRRGGAIANSGATKLASTWVDLDRAAGASADELAGRAMASIAQLPPRERRTVFGIVEIAQADLEIGTRREFAIAFTAKSQIWKYYAIVPRGTPADTFSIRDKDAAVAFNRAPIDAGDRVAASIRSRFPDSEILLWQSAGAIAHRETGRSNLQLLKAGQTNPWIAHLPNPSPRHGSQAINVLVEM